MAVIVGVHGIAQQYRGRYELEATWHTAIRDGLLAGEFRVRAETLRAEDVRVAFFGDLFRPPGAMAADGPAFTHRDLATDHALSGGQGPGRVGGRRAPTALGATDRAPAGAAGPAG
ncbi:hypothetical protein ACW9HD_36990, partial [Nocardia gipuzkoensis]